MKDCFLNWLLSVDFKNLKWFKFFFFATFFFLLSFSIGRRSILAKILGGAGVPPPATSVSTCLNSIYLVLILLKKKVFFLWRPIPICRILNNRDQQMGQVVFDFQCHGHFLSKVSCFYYVLMHIFYFFVPIYCTKCTN